MEFGFIRNESLRVLIERDYAELQGLDTETQSKAVVVLAGDILEGLLIDSLTVAGRWDFDSACQQRLSDMIGPAKTKGIIKEDRLTRILKDYRNLIHPGRSVRNKVQLTKDDADLARVAVNLTIRDIAHWYETPSGKAAVALQVPTASVSPERHRTFLPASHYSVDVRITEASANTFLIVVTNNSDEAFDIAGAIVEFDGVALDSVARPEPGFTWNVAPGRGIDVRWPAPCYVMTNLVARRGKFESFPPPMSIDIIFDCVLDDERRQLRKRVLLQVDQINKYGRQLG
jgi:hypothetical protein